jgi:diguanylate cyclase (GGDEF)-like protein/putative nucleotidyltransferase with HDIG domain
MTRMAAWLWVGGALVSLVVALLTRSEEVFRPAFVGAGVLGLIVAAALALRPVRAPAWSLHALTLLATAVISVCVLLSGNHFGAGASDGEMLYLWVVLYSSYFFTRRQALVQLAAVAVAYAVVLAVAAEAAVAASRWAQTIGTLAGVTFIVQALRGHVRQLVDQLSDAARRDPLTGLHNRRAHEERIARELERAQRTRKPVSVLVGDLDHFKHVNDRLGHPAGDAALVRVATLLSTALRQADPVARTGGEEFALVLPEATQDDAYIAAERLRSAVEAEFATHPVELSMSFGIAGFPAHGNTPDELLDAADQALYAAKALGRNRTLLFNEEVASIMRSANGDALVTSELHLATLLSLAEALDLRDSGTADHSKTVGRYSEWIARELGLEAAHVRRIRTAGVLHDIGKISVSDQVLQKPGRLSSEEWVEMRRHPEIAADLLANKNVDDIRSWVLAHHERPDGKGYPYGLKGEEIPLESRILAVADAYEAMTSGRRYRAAITSSAARTELLRCCEVKFDGQVVAAFLAALDREAVRLSTPA